MTKKHEALGDSQEQGLSGQVERLTAQVETLAQALALQKRSRTGVYRWVAVAGSLVAMATVASVATSQEVVDCDLSLPFCFETGEPARATEVNQNFKALAEDLSGLDTKLASKVDQDASGNVSVTGQLGLRIYRKTCSDEISATDPGAKFTDCACAEGEMAISGGGWSSEVGHALRETWQHTSSPNVWRIGCVDPALQASVACGGMYVVCANVANLD